MLVIYKTAQGGRRQKISQVGAKSECGSEERGGKDTRHTLWVNGHKEGRGYARVSRRYCWQVVFGGTQWLLEPADTISAL